MLDNGVELIWHAGEPLACGLAYLKKLIIPFEDLREKGLVQHAIQTNATLINEYWCAFFRNSNQKIPNQKNRL